MSSIEVIDVPLAFAAFTKIITSDHSLFWSEHSSPEYQKDIDMSTTPQKQPVGGGQPVTQPADVATDTAKKYG